MSPFGNRTGAQAEYVIVPEESVVPLPAGFTMAEAATAAESGEVPASIMSIFAELSGPEQFAAQITWATMTTVSPDEALITAYAAANGLTQAQINAFFIGAATI